MYQPRRMNEQVDQVEGIEPEEYAKIGKSTSQYFANRSYMECQEFATIAFWDLDTLTDQFKCTRFFIAPNPMKRTIQDVEET